MLKKHNLLLTDYSEWFPGTQKPVREGIYQRQFGLGRAAVTYCMWDGARWLLGAASIAEALTYGEASERQEQRWRGLTEQALERINAIQAADSNKKALNR